MCGIAGIYNFGGRAVAPAAIELMTELQHHRGPDDYGYAFFDAGGNCRFRGRDLTNLGPSGPLALGHRRLSIIDLHETGAQPMSSGSERFWIVYNGEIYNYLELREELIKLGYTFRGTSDTEVVLKSYEQWGSSCVERFNGMWAFALWDAGRGVLFCSRDRVGIKPFYYYLDEGCFIFASEIKAVLAALPREKHTINEPYLGRFIIQGLLNDGAETLFANVRQLLPAHNLEIRNGRVKLRRYWDITAENIRCADEGRVDEDEAVERFRELLTDAIRLRFRADVPVGMCLSGGLDSSSVVALATRALAGRLSSFTAEYEEKEFSEGNYARQVAQAFGTEAHFITPTASQYIDFIDRFSWYHDEPCPGPGPFSQWHVMELASREVKVVLEGQGADELLGGYFHYFDYYLQSVLKRICRRGSGRTTLSQFFRDLGAISRHTRTDGWQRCLIAAGHTASDAFPNLLKPLIRRLKGAMRRGGGRGLIFEVAQPELLHKALPAFRPRSRRYRDDLNEILYWELTRDNLPMLLQYGDRTSMAFSIESRLPFLDYRLLEYAGSLPYYFKIRANVTKFLLRRALRGILPEGVVERPDKKGFSTPFALWIKGPLHDYVRDAFNSGAFRQRGIFRSDKVKALLQQHCSGGRDHSWLLWRVLNIERWMQVFFDDFGGACKRHRTGRF